MKKFHTMDVSTLSKYIKNKSISPVELTESILDRINKYNKEYKTFISVTDELAIRQAKQSEKEIMKGIYKGKLHGIPMSIKDNIDVKGIISTKGAPASQSRKSSRDASIVNKLKANGAVIVGKTNMDEYANHITGINSTYGTIKNPLDQNHIVGGSSGGSASAVAAHFSYYSIGTDTAGSVRIPASCCGVYGLKPTNNLIPTRGIHPLSWSLDHVGIIAKSNSDTFYINDVLSPGIGMPQRETKLKENITVGILSNKDYNDDDVNDAVLSVIDKLDSLEIKVKEIEPDLFDKVMDTHFTISAAEFLYSNSHLMDDKNLYEEWNIDFLKLGKSITKEDYQQAMSDKLSIDQFVQRLFETIDILITPTLPMLPPKIDNIDKSLINKIIKYTNPFNMTGLPALSIPFMKNQAGISVGIQLVSNKYQEAVLGYLCELLTSRN